MRTWSVVLAVAVLGLSLAGCSTASTPESSPDSCSYPAGNPAAAPATAPPAAPAETGTLTATLHTTAGDIPLTLTGERTPCTVSSFVSLAKQSYFDASPCHRLTTASIFVLQCGDPTGTGTGGPGYTIPDELDGTETYPAGTVAMANTGDPNTGGSQFFLVYQDSGLPPSYTVFGTMDESGLAVVRDIAAKGTDTGAPDGAPSTPVVINSVTIG